MGKNNSKEIIPTGDFKFMKNTDSDSVQFIEEWVKKYNFEGKLVVAKCDHLVTHLKVEMATGNPKRNAELQKQLTEAIKWQEWLYKLQP